MLSGNRLYYQISWEAFMSGNGSSSPLDAALAHVDPDRRKFLRMLLAGVAAAPLLTSADLIAENKSNFPKANVTHKTNSQALKSSQAAMHKGANSQLKYGANQHKGANSQLKLNNQQFNGANSQGKFDAAHKGANSQLKLNNQQFRNNSTIKNSSGGIRSNTGAYKENTGAYKENTGGIKNSSGATPAWIKGETKPLKSETKPAPK
jgi:hypothetical protein